MDVREKLVEILKQAPFEGKVLDEKENDYENQNYNYDGKQQTFG